MTFPISVRSNDASWRDHCIGDQSTDRCHTVRREHQGCLTTRRLCLLNRIQVRCLELVGSMSTITMVGGKETKGLNGPIG